MIYMKNIKIKTSKKKSFQFWERMHKDEKQAGERISIKIRGGIVRKLILSYLLPVFFVILLGFVSYEKAADSIIKNYKESSLQSISMTSEYLNFAFDTVEAKGIQYITDKGISNYFSGSNSILNNISLKDTIKSKLLSEQISDKVIENIYIISDKVDTMSTANKSVKNAYSSFLNSKGGKNLLDQQDAKYWIGSDPFLDEAFRVTTSSYAFRYVIGFPRMKACTVFDISSEAIEEIIGNLKFAEGSTIGFITGDGRELIAKGKGYQTDITFMDKDFYQNFVSSGKTDNSIIVTCNHRKYLFISSRIGDTGAMVCALIPEADIIDQVKDIKLLTIVLVVIACMIAVLTGVKMASGIKKVIHYVIRELDQVSKGNLSIRLSVKNRDEFKILAEGINSMIDNMRELIRKIIQQSSSVTASSAKVTGASEIFSEASSTISDSVNEIQIGITQQAKDAENCLLQMDKLSHKIGIVSGKTDEIRNIALVTKDSVTEGIDFMTILNQKAGQTARITERVKGNIKVLEDKSKSISKIIETINAIAEQTNLLSLNASIEAARAGEAGKGFTVVAEEIRKLADQSIEAVKNIEGLVKDIQVQTKSTVAIANEADSIVTEQEIAVANTEQSLRELSRNVEQLIGNVGMITDSIDNIDEAKAGTLSAIENISAVSQQTAAAAISVNDTAAKQSEEAVSLNELARELDGSAQALGMEIQRFTIE